jgi:hypothetical protein
MARSVARTSSSRRAGAVLLGVALAVGGANHAFTSPLAGHATQVTGALTGKANNRMIASPMELPRAGGRDGPKVQRKFVEGSVGAKVAQAMASGAVAAVVQALLSAVTEPIVNRVLVKRMSVKDAWAELTPAMIFSFFTTTISTNLIKFPLFEAVAMFVAMLPSMSMTVKGLVVGFIFTTSTLPITNFRYRMSIQTPVAEAMKPGVLYQAYLPTVVRDMVYAIARGFLTAFIVSHFVGVSGTDPKVLFAVVLGSCIISAPFNEIRGFLLQSGGANTLTFGEFFRPANFVRSTSLGALNQAIALASGYYLTPVVAKYVMAVHRALDAGSWQAFGVAVIVLDIVAIIISKSAAGSGKVMSDQLIQQVDKLEVMAASKQKQIDESMAEIARLKQANEEMMSYKDLKAQLDALTKKVNGDDSTAKA